MDTVIKLAKGKYKDGWKSLFEQNKQKVYFLCQWLIKDDYRKDEVFIEVFKEAFSKLDQTSLNTEEDFSKFICLETVKMCKQEEFSGNPHVFKNYKCEHNDFVDDTNKSSSRNFENSKEEIKNCVSKLNEPLQFILYTSKMSSLSTRDLSKVLGVEEMKMDALVQEALQELIVESIPVCEYSSLFTQGMNTTKVPSSTEEKMINFMNENGKNQPKSNNKFMVIALVLLAVIGGIVGFISGSNAKSGDTYIASVEVENYGTIEMELYEDVAPITVKNFVDLAESGFYDGLTFHRIMDGFMIQGGDPSHNGTGGSSTQIKGEFESNGIKNELSHVRGTVSMARSQMPDSASSQFFIVQQDSTFLDGNYAAFGTVTSGMDIVDRIAKDANPTDDNGTIPFEEQPVIKSITIKKKDA